MTKTRVAFIKTNSSISEQMKKEGKNNLLSVTTLTSYLYCPRKVYLQKVLGLFEPPKKALTIGTIKHEILNEAYIQEKCLITSLTKFEDVEQSYIKQYYNCLSRVLHKYESLIEETGLKKFELFKQVWPSFLEKAKLRAEVVIGFMKDLGVCGEQLWEELTPKILPEQSLRSKFLGLSGRIDKIEIHNNTTLLPIEMKTGKMPSEGVWPNHKIQIGAYIMLMNEKCDTEVKEGLIEYLDFEEKRLITMDFALEDEIQNLINKVEILLNGEIPPIVDNKNKCKVCGLKEKCCELG